MGQCHLVLVCLCVFYFLENVDRYLIGVARVPYIDYHSLEYSILAGPAFTIVYSVVGLIIALSYKDKMYLFGFEVDKLTLLSIVALVFSGSFLLTSVANQFWQLCLIRVIMGATQSMITPFSSSIITEQFSSARRGIAFGLFGSATYLAFSFTLSVGTYVYNTYGWRASYLLFGTISTALALPLPCFKVIRLLFNSQNGPSLYSSVDTQSQHGSVDASTANPFQHTNEPDVETKNDEESTQPVPLSNIPSPRSVIHMYQTIKSILCVYWREHPYIYTAALATGVRLGAGYIWSNYTSLFFSPLFLAQTSSDLAGHSVPCTYSYAHYSQDKSTVGIVLSKQDWLHADSGICGESFPYCIEGICKALTSSPWHNKGMSGERLSQFMWWVPLIGSAMGNVLGGLLSDRVVSLADAANTKGANEQAGYDTCVTNGGEYVNNSVLMNDGSGSDQSVGDDTHLDDCTEVGEIELSPYPLNFSQKSDTIGAQNTTSSNNSSAVRFLVCSVGNLLALPFVCSAVLLDYPYCFVVQVGSGLLAELYLGQTLVIVSDTVLSGVPTALCAPSVALFMLLVTLIGGNIPLLLPYLENVWGYTHIMINFNAAPAFTGGANATVVPYSVQNSDARRLQFSMLTLFVVCYGLSAVLYCIAYLQMKGLAVK